MFNIDILLRRHRKEDGVIVDVVPGLGKILTRAGMVEIGSGSEVESSVYEYKLYVPARFRK